MKYEQQAYRKKLKREMNKFLGEMKIPVYNKISAYNFYDTLNAFILKIFKDDHMKMFMKRHERI